MGVWGDEGYKIEGYCFGLSAKRSISLNDAEQLEGWLYMANSIRASRHDEIEAFVARLTVRKFTPPGSDQEGPPADGPESVLGAFVEDDYLHLSAIVYLEAAEFEKLQDEMGHASVLELEATFKSEGYRSVPLRAEQQYGSVPLIGLSISFSDPNPRLEDTARKRLADHLSGMLKHQLVESISSQAGCVAYEICEQAARSADLRQADIPSLVHSATGLLRKARMAFSPEFSALSKGEDNLLTLSSKDFKAKLSTVEGTERYKLISKYNTFWKHFSVSDVLARGQAKYSAEAEGMGFDISELENLARLITDLPHLKSHTLLWAVANALVYAECLAFTQVVASGQTILGQPVAGELKGLTTWKAWRKAVGKSLFSFFTEVVKIGATFVVASAVTSNDTLATWVVTTGVTAARWVMRAVQGTSNHPEQRKKDLLLQMFQAHESLRRHDFHPGVAVQELKAASALGAVFSPWVFYLLDARANSPHPAGRSLSLND